MSLTRQAGDISSRSGVQIEEFSATDAEQSRGLALRHTTFLEPAQNRRFMQFLRKLFGRRWRTCETCGQLRQHSGKDATGSSFGTDVAIKNFARIVVMSELDPRGTPGGGRLDRDPQETATGRGVGIRLPDDRAGIR